MVELRPRREEWQRLYGMAIKIKQLEPWAWMVGTDMFAVADPESGQLGFVSIQTSRRLRSLDQARESMFRFLE